MNGTILVSTQDKQREKKTGDVGMKADDIILQAEKFIRWHGRAGGDLEANFRWWARGKDFNPEDEASIWAAVKAPRSIEVEELVTCADEMVVSVND